MHGKGNAEVSNAPLKPMMLVRPPNSILYDESFWDELAEAGINEVALQWLCLLDDRQEGGNRYPQVEDTHPRALAAVGGSPVQRTPTASFDPNPALYEGLDWLPPQMPKHLAGEQERLRDALRTGAAKGFKVYAMDDKAYFLLGSFGTGKLDTKRRFPSVTDVDGPAMTAARAQDTADNFPEVSGFLLDGPDFKWEIAPGHRDDLWVEPLDNPPNREFAASCGIDMQDVLDGRERFKEFLQSFSPDAARRFIADSPGALADHDWWVSHPEFSDWYRFKQAAVEWSVSTSYRGIKERLPHALVGNSSRLPFSTTITGHNLPRKRAYTDFQMPKEYWWSGGVAGFRGTVVNWVETLCDWNPGLDEDLASQWFSAAFDYPMPDDYPVSAYGSEATDAWFKTSVRDQTRKMLEGAGATDRLVPWVGLEHYGSNWLTPSELDRMLTEMRAQGVNRYCYFVYNSLSPDYWNVIRRHSLGE